MPDGVHRLHDRAIPQHVHAAAIGIALIGARRVPEGQDIGLAQNRRHALLDDRIGVAGVVVVIGTTISHRMRAKLAVRTGDVGIELQLRAALVSAETIEGAILDFERHDQCRRRPSASSSR